MAYLQSSKTINQMSIAWTHKLLSIGINPKQTKRKHTWQHFCSSSMTESTC